MTTAGDAAYGKTNFHETTSPVGNDNDAILGGKTGTISDARDMDRLGKKQELRVRSHQLLALTLPRLN